jgi:NADH-quinone oxidoreductase subunit J
MAPTILYTACVLGAIGLYLLVRRVGPAGSGTRSEQVARVIGGLMAIGAFCFLVVGAATAVAAEAGRDRPELFYAIFSLIAVVCAVRMITSSRPVYSALYFVLVVLASAGLFLLLEAEFMAFALIIVYAGAILITYMFVLMLAQQGPTAEDPTGQPEYDLRPRDPVLGVVAGFLLLALLSRMVLDGAVGLPYPPPTAEVQRASWEELQRMPARVERAVREQLAGVVDEPFEVVADPADPSRPRLDIAGDGSTATAWYAIGNDRPQPVDLPPSARPENVQRVGLALIADFPVSLELAGVILLMAMLGAVILARRQIELTEDEKREAAGLRRLGHHDEPDAPAAGAAGEGGAPA